MKFLLTFILLLWCAPAHAQSAIPMSTCYPRVSHIAAKLGVRPNDPGNAPTVLIPACNGKSYDLFHLIDALLGRMDKTAASTGKTK